MTIDNTRPSCNDHFGSWASIQQPGAKYPYPSDEGSRGEIALE